MFQLLKNYRKLFLGSLLITGVIFTSSLPAMAQTYKGKCKDPMEGDLDGCRVVIENNQLHLEFDDSELDRSINLNRIDNIRISDRKDTDFWSNDTKLKKIFALTWNDGASSHIASFQLEPEDSIELMSFLETKVGRSFENEITNTEQTVERIATDNQRRSDEFYKNYFQSVTEQNRSERETSNNSQIGQIHNSYSGSWRGEFEMDRGTLDSCIPGGQLQFTVDSQGTLRGILLASGEEIQLNGVVKPDGNFVATGNEGTEARGNFSGDRFVGVYGNQTWGCSGRIAGGKF